MSHTKATILCIDGFQSLLVHKMLLKQSGYEVLEATSADQGLQLFLSRPVDAVILDCRTFDCHTAGTNLDRVAAKMKRLHPHVPILYLSAHDPLKPARSVDTSLSKSQPPAVLVSALQDLLTVHRRPFFSRWLHQWKTQNQVVTQ
jgi:response regulator RpfG family c-di-GMP phosphodiesterase